MPYASATAPGGTLAATGLATGQLWLVVVSVGAIAVGSIVVRLAFRRGKGPVEQ
ncbi:hypothetical protein Shyd_86160 [Streptomyces hydrogenans]|uniref:Peptidase n=1 Tax=Streptomyces hydrogenans TaxID=1873719 RepID=A0ABQ3PQG6_9ACTN|nr:hypothetical protein GCM10018784_74230 [Streptomyces hydrogenans]GHI27245.1 hypothetical protein Shyd_86160 [Streptomyces hydrogenans]